MALIVLVYHCFMSEQWLYHLSNVSVFGFFVLSGLVLTRSWNGHYVQFLGKRFVRLWPMYALTLAVGYALTGIDPVWSRFLWFPLIGRAELPQVNPPAWSLCVEAFAMLAMPLFVQRRSLTIALAVSLGCALGAVINPNLLFGIFFAAGAYLSRFDIHVRILESAIPQYLGRISYPLYLSHWLVLHHVPGPLWLKVITAFAVAHVLTITVERWSIEGSRRVRAPRLAART